jgi:hypothetical protein
MVKASQQDKNCGRNTKMTIDNIGSACKIHSKKCEW